MKNLCGQTIKFYRKTPNGSIERSVKIHAISRDRLHYHATRLDTGENELIDRQIFDRMYLTTPGKVKPEHSKGDNPSRRGRLTQGVTKLNAR